jgi:tetratricopeptide (TPR) repeat protein
MHQDAADTCDTIKAIPHIDEPIYSGPDRLHAELMKSAKEAAALARKKKPMEAASHLAVAFTTTSRLLCCSGWLSCPSGDLTDAAGWIAARVSGRNPSSLYLVAYPVPGSQFIDVLADYGEDLEAAGEHLKAVEVFRLLLGADPDRAPTHLALADSLWNTGDRKTASGEYKTFFDSHPKKIPPRVKVRMNQPH